ncbi:hypothetical protein MPSEU_000081400 [Mayamaea pseudoterrestris]|nr:hypothetical protein MPSEU_000081400 [Mayamaea pseudoterrestris]
MIARMKRDRTSTSSASGAAAIAFLCWSSFSSLSIGCQAFTVTRSTSSRLPLPSFKPFFVQRGLSRLAYSAVDDEIDCEQRNQDQSTSASSSLMNDEELSNTLLRDLQRHQHELQLHQDSAVTEGDLGDSKTLAATTSAVFTLQPHESSVEEVQQQKQKAIINARWLLLGAAALYGTNFSLVKLLGQAHLPVGASSTLRFGMAALATSPWLLPSRAPKSSQAIDQQDATSTTGVAIHQQQQQDDYSKHQWGAALLGFEVGAYNAIGYVAQAVGLETTAASKSAFLCSLAVVVVPLLDYLFANKSVSRNQLTGTLMAIGGVAILELGDVFATGSLQLSSGDLASLVQPLCFGLGFWKMEQCMRLHPDEANRSTAAQLMAVFLGSLAYSTIAEPGALSLQHAMEWMSDPQVLFGLFWTGCITTALTVYMETLALKTLSAAETTLIFSTEPIWGTVFASLVMGEQLGIDSGLGAVLILTGCVFSNLGLDGIKQLLPFGKKESKAIDTTSSTAQATDNKTSMQMRTGLSAVFGGLSGMVSGLWTNFAIGTAVFAMDVQEAVDEILNKIDL